MRKEMEYRLTDYDVNDMYDIFKLVDEVREGNVLLQCF